MEEFILSYAQNILKAILDIGLEKLTDFIKEKISNNKYKEILNNVKQLEKEFMNRFQEKFKSNNNDYKNIQVFKYYDKNLVKSMILEIFESENIGNTIQNELLLEIKNFPVDNNQNIINILLIGKESKDIKKIIDVFGKTFGLKNNEQKGIIPIKFNEHFTQLKNIRLIEYNNDKNDFDNINCIWFFIDEEMQGIECIDETKNNNNNKIKTNNTSGSIPIIYIHYKKNIEPERIKKFDDYNISINELNKNYIKSFNNHIIDFNQIGNIIEKEYYLCLIEKSIFNILMKDNEFKVENKSKEILDKILTRTNFLFGNKITYLADLNNQIILKTFKNFLFDKNNVPDIVKEKSNKLLQNYQKYLEKRKKSSFSIFMSKNNDEIILELRKKINDRNLKKLDKDKEEIELMDEIDKYLILYINEMKFDNDEEDKKTKNTKKSAREEKIIDELKIKFEDYYLNRASVFINELVLNYIKETKIDYYNIFIIKYYISLYKNDCYIENEKKEEKEEKEEGK